MDHRDELFELRFRERLLIIQINKTEDETYKTELNELLRETKAQIKKVKGDIAKTYRKAGLDYIYK